MNLDVERVDEPGRPRQRPLAEHIGHVFAASAPADRSRILEQLLRPLGVLSLVSVADGVFAKVRFRSGWDELRVRPEDTQGIGAQEIEALVHHVQQVHIEAVDGLAGMIDGSGSAALSADPDAGWTAEFAARRSQRFGSAGARAAD